MTDLFTSWNGKTPEISEDYIPFDLPEFKYPQNFAEKFNADPNSAFNSALKDNTLLSSASYAAQYLFHCKGIYATSITKFIFDSNFSENIHSFLFFFFSSITLDFMKFTEAAYYCLSHIALSENIQNNDMIFSAFADAYLTANSWVKFDTVAAARMVKACMFLSGQNNGSETSLTLEQFQKLFNGVQISEEITSQIYESICRTPIPLFFTFVHFQNAPDYGKSGMLKKKGGIFKSMKNRFFTIEGYILKYYHDNTKKEQIGEIDIGGTTSSYVEKQKKDEAHLLIKNKDGGPIGYKISKKEGTRKKSNHIDYCAYANSSEEINSWASILNLVSFWKQFEDSMK